MRVPADLPRRLLTAVSALPLLTIIACGDRSGEVPETTVELADDWFIGAASGVEADPVEVSRVGFDVSGWTSTSVPRTVMAALVESGEYEDPYFGRNLEEIPTAQFQAPWWYRTEFDVDQPLAPGARLVFEGINYSAEVWLNGRKVAGREDVLGSFRMFEVNVTDRLVEGANALAVLVYPPEPGDPTIGFVDWNPTSPDRNMGLWRPVKLRLAEGVSLDDVFVRTDVDLETLEHASLTISGTLRNHTEQEVEAVVTGTISDGTEVEVTEILAPGEVREVEFSPAHYSDLVVENPRLWWPSGMGEPNLYDLQLSVTVDGEISDSQSVSFGIREVEDYLTEEGYRGYKVNGKKVLIRGGGWVDDMMLADSPQKIEDQLRYVKHMNLNTIRLEGFWGSSQALYDLADRYGLMVMVGWSCQWEWEEYLGGPVDNFGGIDTPEEMGLIARSLEDQVRWLRNHPSVLVWVLASDMLPRPELEKKYYAALADLDTTRPTLSSCAVDVSEVSGPSGVKMNGPYDWVSPDYWYADTQRGSAYGFNTETGPGPQPPPLASIKRMLPQENWWPVDDMWEFHCGRNEFNTLDRYKKALDERYGEAGSLEDFARLAQVANYEGMRAMFEAFSIRRPKTTGIIQWMLNSAWPEMYWQLYDYYLVPNGAFYGARDASRPVNIAYDYADRSIVVVNETGEDLSGLVAQVRVWNLDSKVIFEASEGLDVGTELIQRVMTLPEMTDVAGNAYFVDAELLEADGSALVKSLYWLSTKPDILDWDASLWFVTPMAEYADLTGLAEIPEVELDVAHAFEAAGDGHKLSVSLSNPSDKIAFFIELEVVGDSSEDLAAPVLWSDNYVTLFPGESRAITAEVPAHALGGDAPTFRYAGVNVLGSRD